MQHNENGILLAQATDEQENYRMQKQPSWCQKNIMRDGKGITVSKSSQYGIYLNCISHEKQENKFTN